MKNLEIDIETYSSVDLKKCGVYKYAESPDFEILLFEYSVDGGAVRTVDLACGERIPKEILDALLDKKVTKWAFNAQFERICLSSFFQNKGLLLIQIMKTIFIPIAQYNSYILHRGNAPWYGLPIWDSLFLWRELDQF